VSCCKEKVKRRITSYYGMISRLRFSQREKRVLIPRTSTPKSGKRRRRTISPNLVNQPSPSSMLGKTKKKLNFNSEEEEAKEFPVNKSILNLPYTKLDDEEKKFETGHEDSVTTGHDNSVFVDIYTTSYENLPSPTP
jgi:hypothetical protein